MLKRNGCVFLFEHVMMGSHGCSRDKNGHTHTDTGILCTCMKRQVLDCRKAILVLVSFLQGLHP